MVDEKELAEINAKRIMKVIIGEGGTEGRGEGVRVLAEELGLLGELSGEVVD